MPEQRNRFIDNDTLQIIRSRTDWRQLFHAFGLERAKKSTDNDWWALSPLSDENTASFHINDKGWYCHSTGQGGGVIELVQKVIEQRTGQALNCYDAGRWLIDCGLAHIHDERAHGGEHHRQRSEKGKEGGEDPDQGGIGWISVENRAKGWDKGEQTKENRPIRQSLVPLLDMEHEEFSRRGISQQTCESLGCGYLSEDSKSPLAGRIVFQVRGVQENDNGGLEPVILTHIGRAMTPEQEEVDGKWKPYAGFFKSVELYHIDKALLDERAVQQARETGHILVVEGCWDVAKLVEAGIENVVATFGAHLSDQQSDRLTFVCRQLGIERCRLWYDRDKAGIEGQTKALQDLENQQHFQADGFDWNMTFSSKSRGQVVIPPEITDVCEFSVEQLRWLRDCRFI